MSETYAAELKAWALRTVIVVALTVATALINRHLGVKVEAPPPPPVFVVVQPAPGTVDRPTVTAVYRP